MDFLNPESLPPVMTAPVERPPRVWKFWGTALWGLFIFAAMFLGQIVLVALIVLWRVGPFDMAAAVHVVGDGTIFAVGDHGLARGAGGAVDPDPFVAHAFADYLALRWTNWQNLLIGVAAMACLVMGWDLLSRATGREVTRGVHGRRAEIGASRWRIVAAGDLRSASRRP